MPAAFLAQSINPQNGMRKVLFTLTHADKPNYVQVDVSPDVLAKIFSADVREGDVWELHASLVSRAGSNGTRPSPLSQKV